MFSPIDEGDRSTRHGQHPEAGLFQSAALCQTPATCVTYSRQHRLLQTRVVYHNNVYYLFIMRNRTQGTQYITININEAKQMRLG